MFEKKWQATILKSTEPNEDEQEQFLGFIEGFAATSHLDREHDIISDEALKTAAKQLRGATVFLNHKHDEHPVGTALKSIFVDKEGIKIRVGISKTAEKVWTLIKEGVYKSFSIFGRFGEVSFETRKSKGKDIDVRVIKELDIYEVSVVGMPANEKAKFTSVISKHFDDASNVEEGKKIMTEKVEKEKIEIKKEVETVEVPKTEIVSKGLKDNSRLDKLEKALEGLMTVVGKQTESITKVLEDKVPKVATTPRTTGVRSEQDEVAKKFDSTYEIEAHVLEQFAKALIDPSVRGVDMYGSMKIDLPNNLGNFLGEGNR